MLYQISQIKVPRNYKPPHGERGPNVSLFNLSNQLQASIRDHGLMHPIVIREDGTLVDGYMRLEACKALRHQVIPAVIYNG